MTLPVFKYHPDPIASGSIAASEEVCRCCGEARGYVYAGAPYAEDELENALCPWCIASGAAATAFRAQFVDADGIGDYGRWTKVPDTVIAEVSQRTPGFAGHQQERWWTHCADAAVFLGIAGREELETRWPAAINAVREEAGLASAGEKEWLAYFRALSQQHGPTAYVFQCRHCGVFGAYSDTDLEFP